MRALICARLFVERARLNLHIACNFKPGIDDTGADERRLLIANAGAEQCIEAVEEHILCFPADGVESERDADRSAIGAHHREVVRLDGGDIVSTDGEVALNQQVAIGDDRIRATQHHVGGDQRVYREARRRGRLGCYISETVATCGGVGASIGARVSGCIATACIGRGAIRRSGRGGISTGIGRCASITFCGDFLGLGGLLGGCLFLCGSAMGFAAQAGFD